MSESSRVIVIAVDGSDYSKKAFEWYHEKVRKENDKVVLVHVTEPPNLPVFSFTGGLAPTEEWGETLQKQIKEVEKIEEDYAVSPLTKKLNCNFWHIPNENPGPGIVKKAQSCHAELIIMGTRGQNKLRRTILGSVSDYVLHHAGIPVAIVPPEPSSAE